VRKKDFATSQTSCLIKKDKDVKEAYVGLSEAEEKKMGSEMLPKKTKVLVTIRNYKTLKAIKNSLVFRIKM
jgi:hypothetical protein